MTYRTVTNAGDVTDEILKLAESIHDGHYAEGPIDWEDFLDRMDGYKLESGETLDLGNSLASPAVVRIKTYVRQLHKQH